MKERWQSLLTKAKPLVLAIENGEILDRPYTGTDRDTIVTTDSSVAYAALSDPPPEGFVDWEELTEGREAFPDNFEWFSWIDRQLLKSNFIEMISKNPQIETIDSNLDFSSALHELTQRDARILLQCYANDHFPFVWERILKVYLNHGFPCGWKGIFPDGNLLVYSRPKE